MRNLVHLGLLSVAVICQAQATFTEYPVTYDPRGITNGPDGNLWFAECGSNFIGRITTAGVVTEFSGATGCPESIANGSDGSLWFTEFNGQKIGRITTTGAITEFPLPASHYPYGITAGPDGSLWFTEFEGNIIGRITTTGVITEFPVPSAGLWGATEITAGPDGNLWFTECRCAGGASGSTNIGRITPTGSITEFPLANGTAPFGITAGPDGNLWFVEAHGNQVGRITTAGLITEYPVPTASSNPRSITAGSDGSLWFTEEDASKIGMITTAGVITEFSVPTPLSNAYDIALGPDGKIWFTEENTNKVARLSPVNPGSAPVWIGLKNSDDQGTQFDVRAEVYENGALVSSSESRCLTGVTRDPASAKQVMVLLNTALTAFNPGDSLALKILARIGTNSDDTKCLGPGGSHSSAVGLRLYYDSTDRASGLSAQIGSNPPGTYFLHSSGSNLFLDALPPITNTAKYKDSSALNFAKGNLWKEVGTWSMTVQ